MQDDDISRLQAALRASSSSGCPARPESNYSTPGSTTGGAVDCSGDGGEEGSQCMEDAGLFYVFGQCGRQHQLGLRPDHPVLNAPCCEPSPPVSPHAVAMRSEAMGAQSLDGSGTPSPASSSPVGTPSPRSANASRSPSPGRPRRRSSSREPSRVWWPTRNEQLAGHCVLQAVCGFSHTVARDQDGRTWAWGSNSSGQCGMAPAGSAIQVPTLVPGLLQHHVVDLGAGPQFCAAVTASGDIWTWGLDTRNQLGRAGDTGVPMQVTDGLHGEHFVAIDCGNDHCLALTRDGRVFSWGRGQEGQLGYAESLTYDYCAPRMVSGFATDDAVVQLAAGATFSLALTRSGKLYAWGDGSWGQCGHGGFGNVCVPRHVKALAAVRVESISTGWNHALAVSEGGVLWAWGQNKYGQLGTGDTEHCRLPTRVAGYLGSQVVVQAMGGMRHTIAVTRTGETYVFGTNSYGQLGLGPDVRHAYEPRACLPPGTQVMHVSAGGEHSLCWTRSWQQQAVPRHMRRLLLHTAFADVMLVVPSGVDAAVVRRYPAHAVIMCTRLPAFKDWLQAAPAAPVREVHLAGTGIAAEHNDAWPFLLEFLYTDWIVCMSASQAEHTRDLAASMQGHGCAWWERLLSLCQRFMSPPSSSATPPSVSPPSASSAPPSAHMSAVRVPASTLAADLERMLVLLEHSDLVFNSSSASGELIHLNKCILWARGGAAFSKAIGGLHDFLASFWAKRKHGVQRSLPGVQGYGVDECGEDGDGTPVGTGKQDREDDDEDSSSSIVDLDDFEAALGHDVDGAETEVVMVPERVDHDAFVSAMKWLYTGATPELPEAGSRISGMALFEAAGELQLEDLMDVCTSQWGALGMLRHENASFMIRLAQTYGNASLKRYSQQLVLDHWQEYEESEFPGLTEVEVAELKFLRHGGSDEWEDEGDDAHASGTASVADTLRDLKGKLLGKFSALRFSRYKGGGRGSGGGT